MKEWVGGGIGIEIGFGGGYYIPIYLYTYLDVSDGGVLPSGELEEEDGQEVAAADGSTAELESRPEVDEEDVGRNEGGTAWTIDGRGGGEMGMRTTGEGRVGSEEEGEGEGG